MNQSALVPLQPRAATPTPHLPDRENELTANYWFELKPRTLTVDSVVRLSPTLARVRFTADDDFDGFPFISPEDHVKLFFDADESGEPRLPTLRDGRWSPSGLTYRDYTVRWFDPLTHTLDVDFVLHSHGVAGRWAQAAQAGQRLAALGPRGAFLVKDVFPWYVLAADETALPALARWVETLRADVPVHAYVQVDSAASRIALPTHAQLTITWLEAAEGDCDEALAGAIMAHPYRDTAGFVWLAGEATAIKPARRWLKQAGFERDHWDVDGYWKRGRVNHDHHGDEEE